MRDIRRKKYEKVVKLLKSENREDIKLGIDYLRQNKFTNQELKWNFPSKNVESRNFQRSGDTSLGINYVALIGDCDVYVNYMWVFAVRTDPHNYYGYEEI